MKAFHNQESVKQHRLDQADFHIAHHQLLAGTYGEGEGDNFKGCSIGCHYQGKHVKAETVDGLPEWYARLADTIFEGLPEDKRAWWHKAWVEAVPVGFESFDLVKAKFLIYLLDENLERVRSLDLPEELKQQVLSAIEQCRRVQVTALDNNGLVDDGPAAARAAARSAARSAEAAAARAAARSAARSAEAAAAWAAARAAEAAAEAAAAWSAADSAARSEAYIRYAEKIISLFSEG